MQCYMKAIIPLHRRPGRHQRQEVAFGRHHCSPWFRIRMAKTERLLQPIRTARWLHHRYHQPVFVLHYSFLVAVAGNSQLLNSPCKLIHIPMRREYGSGLYQIEITNLDLRQKPSIG